jgi:hypothetical protein
VGINAISGLPLVIQYIKNESLSCRKSALTRKRGIDPRALKLKTEN